jgi:hypothetical protein
VTEVEIALRAALLERPQVAALVGTRIYPMVLPQEVQLPALTYQRITSRRSSGHDGASDLEQPRIQIDAWGRTWTEARQLERAVGDFLHGFRGLAGGRVIQAIHAMPGPDIAEMDVRNVDGTRGRYGVSTDYRVAHAV